MRRAGSETEGGVAFLTAATSVAASLNCDVVAEGVETLAEAQVVTLLGVRYVQGYRYCEPGPIEAFLESSVFVFVSLQGLNPECSHPAASR